MTEPHPDLNNSTFARNIAFEFLSKPVTLRERILADVLGQDPPPEEYEAMRQIRERGLLYEFAGAVRK